MDRHHKSPTTLRVARDEEPVTEPELAWSEPTQPERNANANRRDATCDGAYAVALVCLERQMNLVAVARAEDLTGADWYVAPAGKGTTEAGAPNLDDPDLMRLEVGGHDDRPSLPHELKIKVHQLQAGKSSIPGIAVVVGFKKAQLVIRTNVLPG
ncbi:uncharacterized protein SOCEGT47_029210 [Sorangium cellulosum]|uniref:Uncharacterized protein n=1 Tax=Sorangium cellulosum TaxID=56 RepID=A0A4P2Q0H8_SORCE|nr:hypothetical protein [Sorangium cellulosum]AUX22418.1 uncharacterized protein SOCEGT47_029210 [Sorangium cellulosum]